MSSHFLIVLPADFPVLTVITLRTLCALCAPTSPLALSDSPSGEPPSEETHLLSKSPLWDRFIEVTKRHREQVSGSGSRNKQSTLIIIIVVTIISLSFSLKRNTQTSTIMTFWDKTRFPRSLWAALLNSPRSVGPNVRPAAFI